MLKKEELILLIVLSTCILIFLIVIVVSTITRYKLRQQQFLQEKQSLQAQFAHTLLQTRLEMKEETLRHLAYELHDNLGQVASLIKINLNTIQLHDLEKAQQKITDTKDLIRQLIGDLKSLSISLNADWVSQHGLASALENELVRLNKTGQFSSTFHHHGSIPDLDSNTTIILFRMTQEILNNIVKHSQARHVRVAMTFDENFLTLACSDDGKGFDVEQKLMSRGSGLTNLQNRARIINARLSIQSTVGIGTTISIKLPL